MGIDVMPGSEPVAGTLCPEAGPPVPFKGWIELVAALHEQIEKGDGEAES